MAQIGWNSTCESSYEKILEIDALNTKASAHLNELKNKFQLQDDIKEEFDGELGEFEEDAIVTKKPVIDEDFTEAKEPIFEKFEKPHPQPIESDENITEKEEENFSHILDDIFRDDDNDSEPSEVKNEHQFSIEEPKPDKEKSSALEEEEFSDQNFDKWLESEHGDVEPTSYDPEAKNPESESPYPFATPSPKTKMDITEGNFSADDFDAFLERTTSSETEQEPIQSRDSDFEERHETTDQKVSKKREKIVTPTLGEIYTAQHQYAKAIGVYEILKKNNPDNPIYQQKIDYLKKKLEESQNLER